MMCEAFVPLIMAYFVCHSVLADELNCNKGVIEPELPYVLENESIVLTCVQFHDVPGNLTFKQGNHIISDSYIHEVNESVIRMELPPLTREYLNGIGVSLNFMCTDVELNSCIHSIHIEVDYYPIVPTNITCRVYNWEKMMCSWSLGVKYKYPSYISVTAEYILDNSFERQTSIEQLGLNEWLKCPKSPNNTICIWEGDDFQLTWRMFLRVTVENKKRNISVVTQNMSFIMHEINEPAAVDPRKIRIKVVNETCVKVQWQPYSLARNLVFNFNYSSPCTNSETRPLNFRYKRKTGPLRKHVKVTVCGLKSHSNYTFTISGRYRPKHTAIGHWSKAAHKNYTTPDKVPAKSPETIEGLYDHVFQTDRNFTIYWKPTDPCEVTSDVLKYTVSSNVTTEIVVHPSFSTQLMPEELPAIVTILAWNKIGDAPAVSSMTIFPQSMAPTPSELIVTKKEIYGRIGVRLNINPAKQENADIHNIYHVLVSCKRQYSCLEPVYWEFINELELFRPVKDFTQFGLITKGYLKDQPVNTGIIWEKCSYEDGQRPGKPVLKEVDLESQPDGGFRVDWLPLDCSKDHTGYIEYYQVAYCELYSLENCPSGWDFANVSKEETSYTNTDLKSGSRYKVKLKAVGIQGLTSESEPVIVAVDSPASNSWMYAVIVIGVFISCIAIIVAVILVKWCKRRLEKSQIVNCDALKGLDPQLERDPLIQEPAMPTDKYTSSSSDVPTKSTDSGTSSLSSNGTEDSQVSDHLLTNCDSDSVLNMNTAHHEHQPFKSQADKNWVNDVSMTGSHDVLPLYNEGMELSGGTILTDDGCSEVISDFDESDRCSVIETEFDGKIEGNECQTKILLEEATEKTGEDKEEENRCDNVLHSPQTCGSVDLETQQGEINKQTYETIEKQEGLVCKNESQIVPSHDNGVCNLTNDKCEKSDNISEESNEKQFDTSSAQTFPCSFGSSSPLDGYGNGLDIECGDTGECIDLESDLEEIKCDKDEGPVMMDTKHSTKHESDTSIHIPIRTDSDVRGMEGSVPDILMKQKVDEVIKCRNGPRAQDPEHSSGDYQMVVMGSNSTVGSTCNSMNAEQMQNAQNTIL